MKRFCVLLISALIVQCAFAQSEPLYDHPVPVTPAVSNMFRYGETETSLFSGKINYSVAIYQLTDPDFDLDISVSYTSDGFKPRKHSGRVGYNWSLNAGGCIYREIRGVADDFVDQGNTGIQGMYSFLSGPSIPDKDEIFDFSSLFFNRGNISTIELRNNSNTVYDYEPDIFHFNFCGHQGSFMLNNQGGFVSVSGEAVRIKVESFVTLAGNLLEQPTPNFEQKITLTTLDGYQYVFGGRRDAVEYTLSLSDIANGQNQSKPTINAWYLTQIIAPNKRQVDFYYEDAANAINSSLWVYDESYDVYRPTLNSEEIPYPAAFDSRMKHSRSRDVVLDSIIVRGSTPLKITFFNSLETSRLYQDGIYHNYPQNNNQLDSIVVSAAGRRIKTAKLNYCYRSSSDGGFNWRFLSSIYVSGIGAYGFTYPTGTYPKLETQGSNYWSEADFYGYSQQHSLLGVLSRITFPTGGWQTYEYEQHSYGERRHFKTTDDVNGNLVTESISGGISRPGARISRIRTFDSDGNLVETKSYTYQKEDGTSSGVYYDFTMLDIGDNFGFLYYNRGYSFINSHIGYSRVTETTSTPNGTQYKVVSEFATGPSTYQMSSDNNLNYVINHNPSETNTVSGHTHSCSDFLQLGLFSYFPRPASIGRVTSEKIYRGNELQRETIYSYNDIPLESGLLMVQPLFPSYDTEDIVVFASGKDCYASKRFYITPDVLRQKTVKDYTNGHLHLAVEDFQHDGLKRLTESTIRYDYGKWFFSSYRYPDEYGSTSNDHMTSKGMYWLTKEGRIGSPVETYSGFFNSDGIKHVISGRIELYKNTEPDAISRLSSPIGGPSNNLPTHYTYHYQTLLLKVTDPITDYMPMERHPNRMHYDSRYYTACSYCYNQDLRLTDVRPIGEAGTEYVWDGEYLQSERTGSMVSSYTHIPYVGIHSKTDPRGNVLYYDYDSDGRLKEIYRLNNGTKEILQAYEYHFATQE